MEISTHLNRIIRNTYEEMERDSRMRDMKETSVLQNSVNRDMENCNEKSGKKSSTEADFLQNYNPPVEQLVEMERRVEEEHLQMANISRGGNNNGDGDIQWGAAHLRQWNNGGG